MITAKDCGEVIMIQAGFFAELQAGRDDLNEAVADGVFNIGIRPEAARRLALELMEITNKYFDKPEDKHDGNDNNF